MNQYGQYPQPVYGAPQRTSVPHFLSPSDVFLSSLLSAYGAPQPQYGMAPPPQPQYGMAPPGGGLAPPPKIAGAWYASYFVNMLPHERAEAQAWFAAIDRDRSGHITANEIAGGGKRREARREKREENLIQLAFLFCCFVLIFTHSLCLACTFANTPLGWDTASKLVRVFDKDCTGSIGNHNPNSFHFSFHSQI